MSIFFEVAKMASKESSMQRAVVAFISTNGPSPRNRVWLWHKFRRKLCRRLVCPGHIEVRTTLGWVLQACVHSDHFSAVFFNV